MQSAMTGMSVNRPARPQKVVASGDLCIVHAVGRKNRDGVCGAHREWLAPHHSDSSRRGLVLLCCGRHHATKSLAKDIHTQDFMKLVALQAHCVPRHHQTSSGMLQTPLEKFCKAWLQYADYPCTCASPDSRRCPSRALQPQHSSCPSQQRRHSAHCP